MENLSNPIKRIVKLVNAMDEQVDENGEFNCLSCKHCGNINKEDIKEEMFDPYINKENYDGLVRANDNKEW